MLRRLTRAKKAGCEASGEPFIPIAWSRELDEHRAALEATLLGLAQKWPPETIAQAVTIAVNAADPDGADQETIDAAIAAKLVIKTVGSAAMTTIDHTLETAAKLRAVLDHFRDLAHSGGQLAPDGQDRDPVTGDPIKVTQAQRGWNCQ